MRILWIAVLLVATLAAIWSYRGGGLASLDLVWLACSAPPLLVSLVVPGLLAFAVGGLRLQAQGLTVAVRAAHCIGFLGLVYFFDRMRALGSIGYFVDRYEAFEATDIPRAPIEPGFWAAVIAVAVGSVVFDPLRTWAMRRDASSRMRRSGVVRAREALALNRRSGFLYSRLACFVAALGLLGAYARRYSGAVWFEVVPIAAVVLLPYLLLLVSHSPREGAAAFRDAFAIDPHERSRGSLASGALAMEALGRYSTSAGALAVLWCAVRSSGPFGWYGSPLDQALVSFAFGSALRWLFYEPLRSMLERRLESTLDAAVSR